MINYYIIVYLKIKPKIYKSGISNFEPQIYNLNHCINPVGFFKYILKCLILDFYIPLRTPDNRDS